MKNERWTWRPLGELFEIGAGKTMSAAARNGANKTPFLRTSNVFWDRIDLSTVDKMAIPEHELSAKSLQPGDLLVCEGGEIGRAAIWNGEVETMSFQNHLHRLRPIADNAEPRFYVYFLQSAFTQLGIFEGAGNKTTIPNISRSRLAALEVPHPPLDEQQAIAASLAQVREAIQRHDRIAAVAQDLKRAAMRKLFTRGLRGEARKKTEIGPMPQGWNVEPLGNHFEIVQGLSLKGNLATDGTGVPFLRTSNVYWGCIDLSNVSRMHVNTAAIRDLCSGDLLVCEGGEIGRAAVWSNEIENCTYQNHIHRLRPFADDKTDSKFVMSWLEEGFCHRKAYEGAGNKTTIPNLSRSRLAELQIPIPTLREQNEIVAILDAIDRKIGLHRKKRAVIDDLFKTLLHKLMTGSIRAADLDLSAIEPVQSNT